MYNELFLVFGLTTDHAVISECSDGDSDETYQWDIHNWISGLGELPPGAHDEFTDMARLFHDSYFQKDEDGSIHSSMGDSGYATQMDPSKRTTGHYEGSINTSQAFRTQDYGSFTGSNIMSPSLSSVSQGNFHSMNPGPLHFAPTEPLTETESLGNFQPTDMTGFTPTSAFPQTDFDLRATAHGGAQTQWTDTNAFFYGGNLSTQVGAPNYLQQTANLNNDHAAFAVGIVHQRPSSVMSARSNIPQMKVDTRRMSQQSITPSAVEIKGNFKRPSTSRNPSDQSQDFRGIRSVPVQSPSSSIVSPELERNPSYLKPTSGKSSIKSGSEVRDDDFDDLPYTSAQTKALEEAESRLARDHPLYQASPGDDELFHCPYEGKPQCNHKPTKLKCNYDKYVDSHLRPYKCKHTTCYGTQFSSTACLLRHEREAHGMHGHGSKPHLCIFEDCDRAQPGNGFPRRYNLFDHMKRVHDYTPKDAPVQDISPSSTTAKGPTTKKRKSTGDQPVEKRQKTTSGRAQISGPSKAMELAKFETEFNNRRQMLMHQAQILQLTDVEGMIHLTTLIDGMRNIAQQAINLG